jgi:large subunit ribosomal protein L21
MTNVPQTYAVVRLGGRQYKVKEGDELLVDRLPVEPGETVTVAPLLVHRGGKAADATVPPGAAVTARVVDHELGAKIRVFTYKPKSTYKKMRGHRSRLSRVTIESIALKEKKSGS